MKIIARCCLLVLAIHYSNECSFNLDTHPQTPVFTVCATPSVCVCVCVVYARVLSYCISFSYIRVCACVFVKNVTSCFFRVSCPARSPGSLLELLMLLLPTDRDVCQRNGLHCCPSAPLTTRHFVSVDSATFTLARFSKLSGGVTGLFCSSKRVFTPRGGDKQ